MLANKIMVFLGLALLAILAIENMVMSSQAYLFWMTNSKVWIVTIASAIIGFFIWYGFRGMFDKSDKYNDRDNWFDF